ncbi:helix-turn-helix domain-containing protein [Paenibacillus thailandensis]|uniref:Helix-turn-helix domain-containing protein n=1 Tax=Paenibacillus thailandensis TaxID=393250 RepID=A0ABW5QRK5_9BACL
MTIGENIRKFRKLNRLTQAELAEQANMSRSYLADVERDRYNPSVETLTHLARVLRVSPNDLIGSEGDGRSGSSQALSAKEERDIALDLERMISELESNEALAFHGEPMDEETKELMRISLENSLRLAKSMAKAKFNPNKQK